MLAPFSERIDRALAAAGSFLRALQAPDGSWRSDLYGAFKDGGSLTPLVLQALRAAGGSEEVSAATDRGTAYLASMVRPDGTIDGGPFGLSYPAYTASLALPILVCHGQSHQDAAAAWLAFLRERQLTEPLGWTPADREYGGWGYAPGLPRKPAPGQPTPPFTESNLSATVFALEALRAAGYGPDSPELTRALCFVRRCQNFPDTPDTPEPVLDDGGFFFIYDDPQRNKAGVAGTDPAGRVRFASYGSMTADGLRGLFACGLPRTHPRVDAALGWLGANFSASAHPGPFPPGRAAVRASVYFYYCWSVARALSAWGVQELLTPVGQVPWAAALAEELTRRQRPDGSWVNEAVEVREDDPLVATPLAVAALALCRQVLLGR